MNYNNVNTDNSTVFLRLMCAIVFTLFSWCYLYYFQADVIAVAQHVLSGGTTCYDKLIGTLLLTALLLVIQLLVYSICGLKNSLHALTYLPSAVILAMLTNISSDIDRFRSFSGWYIALPALLILSGGIIFMAAKLQSKYKDTSCHLFSRTMWISMLLLVCMFVGVCSMSTTNAVFHYRVKAERCLLENDYQGVLETGQQSLETDSCLTMIRAYALACRGELGEKLFTYPVHCSGNALVPMPVDSASLTGGHDNISTRFVLYPVKRFYARLGACPAAPMKTIDYLHLLEQRGKAKSVVRDYILAVHLVDRNLDEFVKELCKYYNSTDSVADALPRHYREALTLYRHLRTTPVVQYHDEVAEADFKDFQALLRKYDTETERKLNAYEYYFGSYWYYYEFK